MMTTTSNLFYTSNTPKYLCLVLLFFATIGLKAQTIQLTSPDNNISYTFRRAKQSPIYAVLFKGRTLVENVPLWLTEREGGKFAKDLSFGERTFKLVNDQHGYREVTIPIKERDGLKRHVDLIVRAYNDGIAFRYDFAGKDEWKSFTVKNENEGFELVKESGLLNRLNAKAGIPVDMVGVASNSTTNSNVVSMETSWRFMKVDESVDVAVVPDSRNSYSKTN
jgi:hypothetical protein